MAEVENPYTSPHHDALLPEVQAMRQWAGWPRQWKSGAREARGCADADRDAPATTLARRVSTKRCRPRDGHGRRGGRSFRRRRSRGAGPAERAADELSAVRMDVALDPAIGAIGGEMSVTWRNPASQPLGDVWFRLFPNAFYYGEGGLQVADVTVDGAPVSPELALDDTALRVPLPGLIDPGKSAEIALTFTSTVPADSTGSYGIFSRDTATGPGCWPTGIRSWRSGKRGMAGRCRRRPPLATRPTRRAPSMTCR